MRIFLCLITFAVSISSVAAQHWQESFEKAKIAFDGGDFTTASALASETLTVAHQRHGELSNEAVNTLQLLMQTEEQAGNLAEAIIYAKKLTQALEKITGKDHVLYVRSAQSLGNLLIENGQLTEALQLYSSNKENIRTQYSEDNIEYGFFLSDLAFLYLNDGDEDNAIRYYKAGIVIIERSGTEKDYLINNIISVQKLLIKKEKHAEVTHYGRKLLRLGENEHSIATRIDIADAYVALNKNDSAKYFLLSAKSFYDEGKADKGKLFSYVMNQLAYFSSVEGKGQESLQYIEEGTGTGITNKTALFNQAIIAQNKGELQDAEKYYEQLFALDEKGELNSQQSIRLYDYFTLYHIKTNDYKNALAYSQKALAGGKEEYGEKNENYLNLSSHQALVEKSFGHYTRARQKYEALLKDIKVLNLVTSGLYVDVMSNYAIVMQQLNEFHQAKNIFKEALDIAFKIDYKKENLAVLHNNYAVILQLNGDFVEAEVNQKSALKLIKESYGEDHPNYAYNFINLGEIYIKQGNFSGADSVFNHSKLLISKIFGKESPEHAMVIISATNVDMELGRYAKADQAYIAALQTLQNAGSAYQLEYAYGLNDYGLLLQKLGNYSLAERNFKTASDIFKKNFSEVNTDYVSSLGNLANLYQMQDKDDEAERFLDLVLKIDEQLYGRLHPKYSTTLHNLASLYQKQEKIDEAIRLYSAALTQLENLFL